MNDRQADLEKRQGFQLVSDEKCDWLREAFGIELSDAPVFNAKPRVLAQHPENFGAIVAAVSKRGLGV